MAIHESKSSLKVDAFLVYIHRYGFKAGKAGRILGVKWVRPLGREPRPCYHVIWYNSALGKTEEDLVPLEDAPFFIIISESDALAGRIPEVTE